MTQLVNCFLMYTLQRRESYVNRNKLTKTANKFQLTLLNWEVILHVSQCITFSFYLHCSSSSSCSFLLYTPYCDNYDENCTIPFTKRISVM